MLVNVTEAAANFKLHLTQHLQSAACLQCKALCCLVQSLLAEVKGLAVAHNCNLRGWLLLYIAS